MLESTYNHPFFVLGRGWVRVEHLEVGDIVPTSNGQATVVGLAWKGQLATVYNFGVEQTRSYFVGETGAWVHNCIFKKIKANGKDAAHIYEKMKDPDRLGVPDTATAKKLFGDFKDDLVDGTYKPEGVWVTTDGSHTNAIVVPWPEQGLAVPMKIRGDGVFEAKTVLKTDSTGNPDPLNPTRYQWVPRSEWAND